MLQRSLDLVAVGALNKQPAGPSCNCPLSLAGWTAHYNTEPTTQAGGKAPAVAEVRRAEEGPGTHSWRQEGV